MNVKFAIFITFILVVLPFSGCQNADFDEPEYSVAILMHCSSTDNKHIDADAMEKTLSDNDCTTQIYYADKDISLQEEQINDLIGNVDAMIIIPVLDDGLSPSLEAASNSGIKIISYDRLILNTDAVDYYAAYSHTLIGTQQALSLIEGLRANGEGPYNVEIFTGTSNKESVYQYYSGAMAVLQPLIDNGEIVVVSNQTSYSQVHEDAYKLYSPKERLQNLLDTYYKDDVHLHGILSPNDRMSLEFIEVFNDSKEYPIITGQNAKIENIRSIVNGQQYSTVFKNPYVLAQVAANMVIAVLNGETPDINDSTTFDNGKKIVPAYLSEPMLVTRENYQSVLIDSGYYEYIEIFPEY